jgi:hypothetical protein
MSDESVPPEHLEQGSIVDLARGLGGAAEEAHLAGCAACRARIAVWTQLAVTARTDRRQTPPVTTLQRVLDLPRRLRPAAGPLRLLTLVWPGAAAAPLPAGVRGADPPGPVVYEADGVAVDVHVRQGGSRRTVIVGQITDASEPGHRLCDVPVLLLDGKDVAVRGLSNAWGEFHLEHRASEDLRLEVALGGGRTIEVPLPRSREGEDP